MSESRRGLWTAFDAETPVLTYRDAFGPGRVTSLAVRGAEGLFVLSPPYRAPQSAFDDLARYGEVRALVATNAFHHMGIPEWKARFPNAAIFAPEQALGRVRAKTGIAAVEPLAKAAALAGPRLELVDMPYYRTGEVLARFDTARGRAWYFTDIVLNIRRMPRNPIFNLLFRMTASAPGLKWNQVGPRLVMVKDWRALKRWMRDEFERVTPRWLFTTHGEIADVVNERKEVRELFAGIPK
ncbi:MAG TPA: hypothetical protein VHP37_16665 [Burkholderiales bacterium]|nr:hypothetical protein [Burkholderiales bacterium]